jgi:hypothetical protein
VYSVFVLLLLLHCFIFILVLLSNKKKHRVHKSEGILQKSDDLDTQHDNNTSIKIKQCRSNNKTNTEYTSLKVYYSKVMTLDTLCFFLLLLLYYFIFILVLLLCCVSRSSLYCNIPSDLCTLCLSCYYFYIVLSLYLYCCHAVKTM